jgi:hypothetical protein
MFFCQKLLRGSFFLNIWTIHSTPNYALLYNCWYSNKI